MLLKRTRILLLCLSLLIILGALFTSTSFAQGGDEYPPNVDPDEVYAIARDMYCDVCQGVPLADCPSQQCRAWREEVADYLSEGKTEDEIITIMGDRYGEKISGTPLEGSSQRIADWIPIILIGLIGIATLGWIRHSAQGQGTKAFQVAGSAGTVFDPDNRPVPDNVDPIYLERFLSLLDEEK